MLISTAAVRESLRTTILAGLSLVSAAVVDLDLGGPGVTDGGTGRARSHEAAHARLRLENTAVTDAGPDAAQGCCRKLESLSLYGCAITDGGIPALAGIPALNASIWAATNITAEGLKP